MVLGFGFALFSSPNMHAVTGAVDKKFFGIASGTVAATRMLGQMTGMAIAMVVIAVFIGRDQITPDNYDLFLKSINISFSIFVVLCTVGILFPFSRGALRK